MFTGIVTAVGRVVAIERGPILRFSIASSYLADSFELGCSVAHDGVCLTVVSVDAHGEGSRHSVEISPETLHRSTLGHWEVGTEINLERSLKIGDELGGHMVQAHIDGVGKIVEREDQDGWLKFSIEAPESVLPFIAEKGSIAVNGVSLTVNGVADARFDLMIIPHTASHTTFGNLQSGDHVNLEVDVMARYAARLMEARPPASGKESS